MSYDLQHRRNLFLSLAMNIGTRAEVCTFGLKDWILETYERASMALQQATSDVRLEFHLRDSMRSMVHNSTFALSNILVATRYSQAITLSTLTLIQNATVGILSD